ncbi:urease accessory protein UreD [Roseobacter cerasinus]|uniref:Urease accessory protein UreD n=1 Tax=Roseobacter cerasinus TaxID=2602289 RepID=A0A640VV95_9RHOB|nr:urease accessory protein UreD [Roseobacter cerasinus]GFE51582.1 urease accessory protein UreD [Roseobacter cerasinus]
MQTATLLDQPRAVGAATVSSKWLDGRSRLETVYQSGALKVVFPRSTAQIEGVLVNTAGGITGGDRFDVQATAGTGSHLTLTTQAAERAYRAQPGQTGRVSTQLQVDADARLDWLPQETILFEGSALSRRLDVEIASSGRFLMIEPVIFGRGAMGEELRAARFRDRVTLRRAGETIYQDGVLLDGDIAAQLDRPAIGGGARAMANLVLVGPDAEGALPRVRERIGPQSGASLLRPDVLVARLLAEDSYALRTRLVPLLDDLTNDTLPRSWRL